MRLFSLTFFFFLSGAAAATGRLDTNAQVPAAGKADGPPASKADIGPWGAAIVRRAAQLIPTPAQWDKKGTNRCLANATTFSFICALQKAIDEAATTRPDRSDCRFHAIKDGLEGSCNTVFDDVPVFTLARAPAVTTGFWRRDAKPLEIWVGKESDAAWAIRYEAKQVIGEVARKKYSAPIFDYSNDPETTFSDLQRLFRMVEERVLTRGATDVDKSADDVEIEIYSRGTGLARTYAGWFPISGFRVTDNGIRFQLDGRNEVPPNAVDREILERAAAILGSDAVWNRADNRVCPATAKSWSIYCAIERAQIDVVGGFHHRRPAGEIVREIVDARTKGRPYEHRMMDYNNDPTTHLSDVKSLFAEAIARIK
ncbi:MAG TPA: hypothetical protein VFW19_17350 [Allosphingosinicella sp.]|nr:hypothetical protein [Allosphingosinicella sp.]